MTLRAFSDLIRPAPPLAADDTAAKAARLLRARGLPALPIARDNQLLGAVHEDDLALLAAQASDPGAAAAQARAIDLARPFALVVRDDQEAPGVLLLMRERGVPFAAVVAADGRYLGLVLQRELMASLVGAHAAPSIAGLATPFGVHLTTGALRAGANDLSLAATGVAMMAINLLAVGLVVGFSELAKRILPTGLLLTLDSHRALALVGLIAAYVVQVAVFLALLRISPLTRIHAAEHMVVHAIEEGEDLTVEKVRAMPRVHPRCGTNLMALLILMFIGLQLILSLGTSRPDEQMLAFLALAMIIVFTWRRLGAGLQRWVTTRQPTDRQLQRAIAVGEALLAQVNDRPGARATPLRRFWNAGFLQVVAGFLALSAVADYGWPLVVAVWKHLGG
jgi:CBS domain-containing protein